ncbi:MAG: flagellar export protein FliJ [Peptococcaceae bacterium]|nr:flagellar export protein FliJ [Peptococcaceae bacterium]
MAFKFRLESILKLAEQKMKVAEGILARELRTLQAISKQKDLQAGLLTQALAGQKAACLNNPENLGIWQKYSQEQKEKLLELENEVQKQQVVVEEKKEKLLQCRIEVEKLKRLKEKKLRIYNWEELKKEQNIIDEIAQSSVGRNSNLS